MVASCSVGMTGNPELAMNDGMDIQADTAFGKITIEAIGPYIRKYSWRNKTKQFRHQPRNSRWLGSKGIYRPTGDRDMHAVLEEGQQHFHSEEEVYHWLEWQKNRKNLVYTSDGLVVGWYEEIGKSDGFNALIVVVWQIYVQGKKPGQLKGAQDEKVIIRNRKTDRYNEAGTFSPMPPNMINDRRFFSKALDYMKEFNISPSQVERVVSKAKANPSGEYFWYHGWLLEPQIDFSVCTDTNGNIVLVIP